MASESSATLVLEIDGRGVLAALAILKAKRESGESQFVKNLEVRSRCHRLQLTADIKPWALLFQELGLLSLSELHLSLRGYSVSTEALAQTIRQTSDTLISLTFDDALFDGTVDDLSNSLQEHPSLKRFLLFRCRVVRGEAITDQLIQCLSSCPKLQVVHFDSVAPFQSRDGLGPSLQKLSMLSSLQDLILNDFELKSDWIAVLFRGLKRNTVLKRFCAMNKFLRLQQSGLEALTELLMENSSLEELSITVASLNLQPLAEGLGVNRTLRCLTWDTPHRISDEASGLFATMLEKNCIIENVTINASPTRTRLVEFYLKLNRAERGRLMGGATQREWVEVIISSSDDISVLFYLLSKNPSLCQRSLSSTPCSMEETSRERLFHAFPSNSTSSKRDSLTVGIQQPKKKLKLEESH